ncbi:MAG TPA: hypothetical protein VHE30_20245 [Polyangiaceae bacterium]|nr:hypothetical protein [Polyangiaceae bacterium]
MTTAGATGRTRLGGCLGILFPLLAAASGCGKERLDLGKVEAETRSDAGVRDGGADSGVSQADGGNPPEPYCDHENECRNHQVCVTEKHRCGECTQETADTQCGRAGFGSKSSRQVCDLDTNLCEDCLADADCVEPFVCNPKSRRCTVTCTADPCFTFPITNLGVGACVEGLCQICRDDSDCTALQNPYVRFGSHCRNGDCAECVTDGDCSPLRPHCGPHGACVE